MNFLAHFHLATLVSTETDLDISAQLAGAFLADYVRGPVPPTVLKTDGSNTISPQSTADASSPITQTWQALYWHRRVDSFTDQHPHFIEAKKLLPKEWRRYAPILVDVYFDYCLATDFSNYRDNHGLSTQLATFSLHCYHQLDSHQQRHGDLWPASASRALEHMKQNDWLGNYSRIEGIEATLDGISRRMKKPVQLADSLPYFIDALPALHALLTDFMPKLEAEILSWAWAYQRQSPYQR